MTAPPPAQRFEPVPDRYGKRIAWVFGNQAPGGRCPYRAAGRCHHCDIGDGEGRQFTTEMNLARLDWLLQHDRRLLDSLAHLVVYNSGSVLNPRELAPAVLLALCEAAGRMTDLRVISLDTREPYLRTDRLLLLAERLPPGVCLRPILGLESADDLVRQDRLDKRMPKSAVRRALDAVAEAANRTSRERIGLDANLVLGAPGVPADQVADDAAATALWLLEECSARSLSLDLNLHPYYPSRRGLGRYGDHPRCPWPAVRASVLAIAEMARRKRARIGLFLGMHDERHDQEPAARARELAETVERIHLFNRTQDPEVL